MTSEWRSATSRKVVAAQLKRALAVGLAAIGICAPTFAETPEISFMHMWQTEGERLALQVFGDAAQRSGLEWREISIPGNFNGVRAELTRRLINGDLPDAVQWIIGGELTSLIDAGIFRVIKDPSLDFGNLLLPEVYEISRHQQGLSNVPVGIHTLNHVVFRLPTLNNLGLNAPNSWQEFSQMAPEIHRLGVIPLVISNQNGQAQNLFISILSTLMTKAQFRDFIDVKAVDEPARQAIREAFRLLAIFSSYKNADYQNLP